MTQKHILKDDNTAELFARTGTGILSLNDFSTVRPNSLRGRSANAERTAREINRYNLWKAQNENSRSCF